jgi:hypothetical protein
MTVFLMAFHLLPSQEGQRQLEGWPETTFTPDFAVAASGSVTIEFDNYQVGDKKGWGIGIFHLTEADKDYFTPYLPDYLGGLALNLAKAAVKIKDPGQEKSSAKFLDEPMELLFTRINADTLKVSLRYQGETIAETKGPKVLILAIIGSALQNFMVQLLTINPRLAEYEEVAQLRGLIAQIVS